MKSVLDLYKALMQRKLEVTEAKKTVAPAEKAPHASSHTTQTIPAAAVRRSRRTDIAFGMDSDYERV